MNGKAEIKKFCVQMREEKSRFYRSIIIILRDAKKVHHLLSVENEQAAAAAILLCNIYAKV